MSTPQALLVDVIHWFWTAKYLPLILLTPTLYFVPQALHVTGLWAIEAYVYLRDVIVWLVCLRGTWIYLSICALVYFIHPETSPFAHKSRDTVDTGKKKFQKYMESQKAEQQKKIN
jgi:hypothetical protein